MKTIGMRLSQSPISLFTCLILILFLVGCSFVPHAQMVREAQDELSAGAELENLKKFGGPTVLAQDSEGRYSAAAGLIQQALDEAEGDLKSDDLYGTAMTIRAVALWRLGDTIGAEAAATTVVGLASDKNATTTIWPRDLALCSALPALIRIDAMGVAAEKLKLESTADEAWETLMQFAKPKKEELRDAAELIADGHQLRVYLALSECEMVYALYTGLNKMKKENRKPKHISEYEKLKAAAIEQLENLAGNPVYPDTTALNLAKTKYKSDLGEVAGP